MITWNSMYMHHLNIAVPGFFICDDVSVICIVLCFLYTISILHGYMAWQGKHYLLYSTHAIFFLQGTVWICLAGPMVCLSVMIICNVSCTLLVSYCTCIFGEEEHIWHGYTSRWSKTIPLYSIQPKPEMHLDCGSAGFPPNLTCLVQFSIRCTIKKQWSRSL